MIYEHAVIHFFEIFIGITAFFIIFAESSQVNFILKKRVWRTPSSVAIILYPNLFK